MGKLVTTCLTGVLLAGPALAIELEPRRLTPTQAAEDVSLLKEAIETVHPGFGRYTAAVATTAELDELAKRVGTEGATDAALYVDVSRILARLRCDHTKAELPTRISDYRRQTPSFLPFAFRIFAGRLYVAAAQPGVALERGDEVTRINGRPVGDVLADISTYLSVDGWTDFAKRTELEDGGGELMVNGIDHFWPLLYGWPDQWRIETRRRASGKVETINAAPIVFDDAETLRGRAHPGAANFADAVSFRVLDDSAALLRIDTFVNYRRPVDPVALLEPIFREIREKSIDHLILDLRKCGGGSDDAPAALGSLLFSASPPSFQSALVRTYRFGRLREHMTTWDESIFNLPDEMFRKFDDQYFEIIPDEEGSLLTPHPLAFKGRLSVLTGPFNQSGATIAIAMLRAFRPNTRLVGEPTGGSSEGPTAGTIFFLKLPNSGITVRVPALRSRLACASAPGMGVNPDVLVRETVEDWLAATDRVLDVARQD